MKTLDDLALKDNEREAIRAVKEVILFGSKARGDDDLESDIDLLLLPTRPIHWKERHSIVEALFDIEMKYDVVISIIVNSVNDWQTGLSSLLSIREEINQEGIPLFCFTRQMPQGG